VAVAIESAPRARARRSAARLTSLEAADAARAGYGDAARTVLVQANGTVNAGRHSRLSRGRGGYERAVEAVRRSLEQVVVERAEARGSGLQLVREAGDRAMWIYRDGKAAEGRRSAPGSSRG